MKTYVTVYSRFDVKNAINNISKRVSDIIENKGSENCIIMTVLEGGSFLSHKIIDKLGQDMLSELITTSIKISSYQGTSRGQIKFDYIPDIDLTNKTVIVVDDFCDSGNTVKELHSFLKNKNVAEDVFVTLLARTRRQIPSDVKLIYGIEDNTSNYYIGCGMDEDNKSRYVENIITIVNT